MNNKKPCKECPWVIENNHNKKFTEFIKKHNKKHNCHMLNKNIYDINENELCKGLNLSTFLK